MFKLNDVVVVRRSGMYHQKNKLAKITKVTKTGQVETDGTGEHKFNSDGSQRGRDAWGGLYISLATEADIQEITERDEVSSLLSQIKAVKMESLSKDKLQKILDLLKE